MAIEPPPTTQEPAKITLQTFVDEHHKMISVIGVLVALGLLWRLLARQGQIPFVTYLCFFAIVPLLLQIIFDWMRVKKSTVLLRIFMDIFIGIFFLTLAHLVADYPDQFDHFLTYAIPAIVYLGIIHLLLNAGKIVTYLWEDFIHIRAQWRGLKIEEIRKLVEERSPKIKQWAFVADVASVIIMFLIFVSWSIVGDRVRSYILPSIGVLAERPIKDPVEQPKEKEADLTPK